MFPAAFRQFIGHLDGHAFVELVAGQQHRANAEKDADHDAAAKHQKKR